MKKLIPLLALIPLVFCGCSGTSVISPALMRSGVAALTRTGTHYQTNAIPAVRVAKDVICTTANSTNLAPGQLLIDIQNSSDWEKLHTPEAELIINGVILLYESAWNAWGSAAVNNVPVFKEYLGAVCLGLGDGLTVLTVNRNAVSLTPLNSREWPMLPIR